MNQRSEIKGINCHSEVYIDQKNIVLDMIQSAKNNYFTEKVMECDKDQKSFILNH